MKCSFEMNDLSTYMDLKKKESIQFEKVSFFRLEKYLCESVGFQLKINGLDHISYILLRFHLNFWCGIPNMPTRDDGSSVPSRTESHSGLAINSSWATLLGSTNWTLILCEIIEFFHWLLHKWKLLRLRRIVNFMPS